MYELKQRKPWFDEECLQFLDERKQDEMQWLQDPNQRNVDKLNNVSHEAIRHFRNQKEEYLKAKIDELHTNCQIKNIREWRIIRLIWLHTPTVFWQGGGTIPFSY